MSVGAEPTAVVERPIAPVRGTSDRLPAEFARLAGLERLLLDRFARAGYEPMRTPVLEPTELHERKSGAAIVTKLYELAADGHGAGTCLRPELTAGIVRAYTAAAEAPALPFRVASSGPVFRKEKAPRPGLWREFQQAGVELIGASGPAADGEVIWLADWALAEAGVRDATIRLGHVGLILELLRRSGLPSPARTALVETLSESAAEGGDLTAMERGLDNLADWLGSADVGDDGPPVAGADDPGVDRLFRTLVPVVNGRRPGHEIIGRLRRKWDLGRSLQGVLDRVRAQVRALAALAGPADEILGRLARDFGGLAPESVAELRGLVETLGHYGIDPGRIRLDFGFGRGIGFYSQVIFELIAPTPGGPVEVCGGGRYDGLARVLGSDRDDRGVGFAFGLERLLGVLDAQGGGTGAAPRVGTMLHAAPGSPEAKAPAVALAVAFRKAGARVVVETERPLPEALAMAAARGLARVAHLDDPRSGRLALHDPGSGRETEVDVDELHALILAEIGGRR